MDKVLSIAGFDGSGGAGIQADLKTFSAFGCFGMTVLTALPIQNTQGVKKSYPIPPLAVKEQLEAIFEDIIPDAIKIGMLANKEVIEVVTSFLKHNGQNIPIVLDPVMVATSGDRLLSADALETLKELLIPLSTLTTPNISEAKTLIGPFETTKEEMETAAQKILLMGSHSVLLKGGHLDGEMASDLYLDQNGTKVWLKKKRIKTKNTHGTGCTLSAAIASSLAMGFDLLESCKKGKAYLHQALIAAKDLRIGKGSGPLHHFHHLQSSYISSLV
ncbi:bifunctional hydroxymethylpyrimidine kinase/phosphomethylpyrimidine kinase [Candidatus Neptunochlamydia vexilliferae]|uniref:hydroxymethylpyrimidine kinase n=1 Tax=Candidatus Neptunichlamydia vexilliferae TaxID=1651774 RepID=A0ABS0AZH3_9BACT|nr:bifunctional hydroxymethylpyrimidine kinase/phosphomethylpyrimidine kinase [Candidatus Neptunochlamydia vexilliferae]MBF5059524.1 Hydroxymethylpyrimidine/phosphomethylpyrimidine kinase [Candidatus Neptunochlamydia vexilliferae]